LPENINISYIILHAENQSETIRKTDFTKVPVCVRAMCACVCTVCSVVKG